MTENDLLKEAGKLGFQLFESGNVDAGAVLSKMAESDEARLWEGFAVVLANAMEKDALNQQILADLSAKDNNFRELLFLSQALYKILGLKFSWLSRLEKNNLTRVKTNQYFRLLKSGGNFKAGNKPISAERLITTFKHYYSGRADDTARLLNTKNDLGLEYAMSSVFSTRQKEIFLKKFRGERLNKTEREYYSRTVKKKVSALANEELHRMAKESSR